MTRAGQSPSIKIPIEAHATLRRIALDLGPGVGRVLTLGEVVAALVTIADRDREPVRAELAGEARTD